MNQITDLFSPKTATINVALAGNNLIVPAIPGRKIRVNAIKFSVAGDVTTTWKSNAVAIWPAETWKAGGGMSDRWGPHGYFFETNEGEALNLALSGNVQVSGGINYIEV